MRRTRQFRRGPMPAASPGRVARAVLAALALAAAACSGSSSSESAGASGGGAGATAPTTAATAPPTTRPPRHFTLVGVGDILAHYTLNQQALINGKGVAYDYDPMFDAMRDTISAADLAICHMETPITPTNTNLTRPNIKIFNTPHEIAPAVKNAGFDACDTASNHTWDQGVQGVKDTLDVLDAAGIAHSGSGRNQAEMDSPPIYDVKGVKVGHLAYSYTITNSGQPTTWVPENAPWLKDMLWPAVGAEGIVAAARKLRERGAEVVVVSMHWGTEYQHQPNDEQRRIARQLLESPEVDVILGDHVHMVQPCEKINGKYVIYGMGNFLSNQSPTQDRTLVADNQDGSLHTFTFDEVSPGTFRVTSYVYTPTWVVYPGRVVTPATPDRFPDSYNRTVANLSLLGPGACDAKPAF